MGNVCGMYIDLADDVEKRVKKLAHGIIQYAHVPHRLTKNSANSIAVEFNAIMRYIKMMGVFSYLSHGAIEENLSCVDSSDDMVRIKWRPFSQKEKLYIKQLNRLGRFLDEYQTDDVLLEYCNNNLDCLHWDTIVTFSAHPLFFSYLSEDFCGVSLLKSHNLSIIVNDFAIKKVIIPKVLESIKRNYIDLGSACSEDQLLEWQRNLCEWNASRMIDYDTYATYMKLIEKVKSKLQELTKYVSLFVQSVEEKSYEKSLGLALVYLFSDKQWKNIALAKCFGTFSQLNLSAFVQQLMVKRDFFNHILADTSYNTTRVIKSLGKYNKTCTLTSLSPR